MVPMVLRILPTLGPLHLLHPRYNAATLWEMSKELRPEVIHLASWPERPPLEEEPALWSLFAWAEEEGIPLEGGPRGKEEAEAFREALRAFPRGEVHLERIKDWEEGLKGLLLSPLTPGRLGEEAFLEELRAHLETLAQAFGEGPATGHRRARMEEMAQTLRGEKRRALVLVEILDYPYLLSFFPEAAPQDRPPTERERERALLDRAWLLREEDDWGALLKGLFEISSPEALFLAGQIYLAAGQPEEALALFEEVFRMDFQTPPYLPGYFLARFGQLLDHFGERERALRAYRGVLALSFAPQEAREIALAGLRAPFRLSE
ncbi:MAG: tetratricopeptide repeat protein [Thermaceae bacterium]